MFKKIHFLLMACCLTLSAAAKTQLAAPVLNAATNVDATAFTASWTYNATQDVTYTLQVLNTYDQETTDFFRWREVLTQAQISSLLNKHFDADFGDILDLIPVKRGRGGHLVKLKIVGTKKTFTIGKELEIRKALSDTHLKSSAFVIDKEEVGHDNVPARFVLTGAGWGHGVGLCQIGAAVMGAKGYNYRQILNHYYQGADVSTIY